MFDRLISKMLNVRSRYHLTACDGLKGKNIGLIHMSTNAVNLPLLYMYYEQTDYKCLNKKLWRQHTHTTHNTSDSVVTAYRWKTVKKKEIFK